MTKVPKHPIDSVPAPEESTLKEVPGAWEAWKGLSSLGLQVCTVRGTKIIIRPEQLAAFQHAPLSVSEEVQCLEREHLNYEDLLAFLATDTTPNPTNDDPRPGTTYFDTASTPAESAEFAKYDSIDALLAHVPEPVETLPWVTRTSPC